MSSFMNFLVWLLHEKAGYLAMREFHRESSHAHWQNNREQVNRLCFLESLHLHVRKLLQKPEASSDRVLILFLKGES